MSDNKPLEYSLTFGYANPMIYVMSYISKAKEELMTNEKIIKLIKTSLNTTPNRKDIVLMEIENAFPEFKETINKYKILL